MLRDVILLHGAIGSKDQLQPLAEILKDKFRVHSFNFSGHGGRSFPAAPFSIPLFSNEIAEYMQDNNIVQTSIFGYSMGGYAAMYFAKHNPEKINKLVTLATKYHWDEAIAAKEIRMLNPATITEKVPAFTAQLEERHAPNDWKELLNKTKEMLLNLGKRNTLQPTDYNSITTSSLILLGDRDKMVTLDETMGVYKQLPSAQFGILPGTPHPLEQVNIDLLAHLVEGFIYSPTVPVLTSPARL